MSKSKAHKLFKMWVCRWVGGSFIASYFSDLNLF